MGEDKRQARPDCSSALGTSYSHCLLVGSRSISVPAPLDFTFSDAPLHFFLALIFEGHIPGLHRSLVYCPHDLLRPPLLRSGSTKSCLGSNSREIRPGCGLAENRSSTTKSVREFCPFPSRHSSRVQGLQGRVVLPHRPVKLCVFHILPRLRKDSSQRLSWNRNLLDLINERRINGHNSLRSIVLANCTCTGSSSLPLDFTFSDAPLHFFLALIFECRHAC